jgi:hypothetical protein
MKNGYKNIWIITIIVTFLISISGIIRAGKIEIPEEEIVKLKFESTKPITSGTVAKGVPLLIRLEEPIMVGDEILVEKGAPGTAIVSEVEKASKPGKPGKIRIEFSELEPKGTYLSPDDSKIKLSGSVESNGKGKKLLSILFIAGLFIKGGEAAINIDSVYTATITESIILESQ